MTPGSDALKKGISDTGTNLSLPILFSKKYGPVVIVSDAGIIMSLNDFNKPAQILLSVSAGVNLSQKTILTGEIFRTSAMNLSSDVLNIVDAGLSTKISDHALLYMSVGQNLGETSDGASHFYA